MINIAIVDDESAVANKLKNFIDKYFGDEGDGAEYTVKLFADGVNFLSSQYGYFDIVFMDIRMPMMDGIEVAQQFREKNETACLIFVTNLADMAIKGYEVNALDFVVKPIEYGDFKYRMAKAVRRVQVTSQDSIVVISDRQPIMINVHSIMYVETILHKVIYHTISGTVEAWGTMREAESKLKKYNFSRCNSGYLVNLRYVENVRGSVVHIGDVELSISRSRRQPLLSDMMNFFAKENGGGGI